MPRLAAILAVAVAVAAVPGVARADTNEQLKLRLDQLEQDNKELRKLLNQTRNEVAALREDHAATDAQVKRLLPLANLLTGYLDVGLFWVGGDGSGVRPDIGNVYFPEYKNVIPGGSWVFMGDPLSTAINSRGDPADTGPSRAVTFNPIGNQGKATFIVNALTLALFAAPVENLQFNALVDFVPRGRDVSNPNGLFLGDYLDVKLAYGQYDIHARRAEISLYAGKIDSVLGYEYRIQESPDRVTVTPSLICRYTCGRPIGLKMRARFFDERLIMNVAVTNGSSFSEQFPFNNQIDTNYFKTVSGRLSYKFPVGAGLEIGASGAFGAQDLQPDDGVHQWHYGVDAHLDIRGFELTGEFVQGNAQGKTEPMQPHCNTAPCLEYKGAYGLLAYRALNWLMPYARVDWRQALHQSGASFVYIADLVRLTVGVRLELGTNVIVKAEYTYDRKLGRLEQFFDDIFTSSLVIKF